jgi:hypothetical protein
MEPKLKAFAREWPSLGFVDSVVDENLSKDGQARDLVHLECLDRKISRDGKKASQAQRALIEILIEPIRDDFVTDPR